MLGSVFVNPHSLICARLYSRKADLPLDADLLRQRLAQIDGLTLTGAAEAPQVVGCAVEGVPSQNLINVLQDHDCYVSAGSACSKGHRSHVLEACGLPPALIDGSLRLSLSRFTTPEEVEQLAQAMADAVARLKKPKKHE